MVSDTFTRTYFEDRLTICQRLSADRLSEYEYKSFCRTHEMMEKANKYIYICQISM